MFSIFIILEALESNTGQLRSMQLGGFGATFCNSEFLTAPSTANNVYSLVKFLKVAEF